MGLSDAISNFLHYDRKSDWMKYEFPKDILERVYRPFENHDSVPLIEKDWDNLIILDACRYDVFDEVQGELKIKGTLSERRSMATKTIDYFRANYYNNNFDTVYVSANPYVLDFKHNFYDIVYVESTPAGEEYATVLPETVTRDALQTFEKYPNKRIIIHFIQPHHPFIGDTKIPEEFKTNERGDTIKGESPFHLLAKGKLSDSIVWQAYKDNLIRTFESLELLLSKLSGKSVITSDHGEMFGESPRLIPIKLYGHGGPRLEALVSVPWLEVDYESRREIQKESSRSRNVSTYIDEDRINKRLKNLGYRSE